MSASVAGQPEHSVGETALVPEPIERLETGGHGVRPAECFSSDDQRLWEAGVVITEVVLEPAPCIGRRLLIGSLELDDEPLEKPAGFGLEPVRVERAMPRIA